MNKKRLEKLAEWLEGGAKHKRLTFRMDRGYVFETKDFDPDKPTDCGVACCIAGAAMQFFAPVETAKRVAREYKDYGWLEDQRGLDFDGKSGIGERAAELLNLTPEQAHHLFVPSRLFLSDYNDPAWAARTIRHLIATGEVDWEATRETGVEGQDRESYTDDQDRDSYTA